MKIKEQIKTRLESLKEMIKFLDKFKDMDENQINSIVYGNPSKTDKAYNKGSNDICKKQLIIINQSLKKLKAEKRYLEEKQ